MGKFKETVKDEPIGLMKPMRLEFSYGCLANSLSVNDIEEADLTDAQRRIVIHRIFSWIANTLSILILYCNTLWKHIVMTTNKVNLVSAVVI